MELNIGMAFAWAFAGILCHGICVHLEASPFRGSSHSALTSLLKKPSVAPLLLQVPAAHITRAELTPDIDSESLSIKVHGSKQAQGAAVRAVVLDKGKVIVRAEGKVGETFKVDVKKPNLWSPDSPYLYDLDLSLVQDEKAAGELPQVMVHLSCHICMTLNCFVSFEQLQQRQQLNNDQLRVHAVP